MASEELTKFINSKDYRDICYFIDHKFDSQDICNSCCEELGYSIGVDIVREKTKVVLKSAIEGAQGEFRVVSNIQYRYPIIIAETIILKK